MSVFLWFLELSWNTARGLQGVNFTMGGRNHKLSIFREIGDSILVKIELSSTGATNERKMLQNLSTRIEKRSWK